MIEQLTVFLENEKGRLAAACQTLADAGINILDCWMPDPKSRDIIGLGIRDEGRGREVRRED